MNQLFMAPLLIYLILYSLSHTNIYKTVGVDSLLNAANRKAIPDLQRMNIIIFIFILSIFLDTLIKTLINRTTSLDRVSTAILLGFPYGLIIFVIGMIIVMFNDQTDPADLLNLIFTFVLILIFAVLSITFYVILYGSAADFKDVAAATRSYYDIMPIFKYATTIAAFLYVLVIYYVAITGNDKIVGLAAIFLYIIIGLLIIANISSLIMTKKIDKTVLSKTAIFCITWGLIIQLIYTKYDEWTVYPVPLLAIYYVINSI